MKTYSGFIDKDQAEETCLELRARGFFAELDPKTLVVTANDPTVIYVQPQELNSLLDHGGGVVESQEVDAQGSPCAMLWVIDKTPSREFALIHQQPTRQSQPVVDQLMFNLLNNAPIQLVGSDVNAFVKYSSIAQQLDIYEKNGEYFLGSPVNEDLLQQDLIQNNFDVVLIRNWS